LEFLQQDRSAVGVEELSVTTDQEIITISASTDNSAIISQIDLILSTLEVYLKYSYVFFDFLVR
jgi:hypothetical protein